MLFTSFMDYACRFPQTRLVLLPRNQRQGEFIRRHWPHWFEHNKTVVPPSVVDGLNLIWHSDLLVSGGGTMNREATALGIPVYSIFLGAIGAVDRHLQQLGRLILIKSVADIAAKMTQNARLVLTDSGGLQEESTFFRTPCLTLRPNTERPVTITLASNRLTQLSRLPTDIDEVLNAAPEIGRIPPLWDGKTAVRIIDALIEQDRLIHP